jgi:hypothetical protein
MLPLLPLIPLALELVPQIAKWIGGEHAEAVTREVADAVKTVTGLEAETEAGAAAAQARLAADPALKLQVQMRLAEIVATREAQAFADAQAQRQAELDGLRLQIQDLGDARKANLDLAKENPLLAWVAPVVSGLILILFGAMLLIVVISPPQGTSGGVDQLALMLLGTLAAMATQVANYWLGSSSGSKHKTDLMAASRAAIPPASVPSREPVAARLPTAAAPMPPAGPASTDDLNERVLRSLRGG